MLDGYVLDTNAGDMTDQVEGDRKIQERPAIPDMDPSEDAGFTVKIQAPGTETTDFQVNCCLYLHNLKLKIHLLMCSLYMQTQS